jgi:PKD repeat protein
MKSLILFILFVFGQLSFAIAQNKTIYWHNELDLLTSKQNGSQPFSSEEVFDGRYYRIIQFDKLISKQEMELFQRNGIILLEYIPDFAYLVSLPVDLDSNKDHLNSVLASHTISNSMKLSSRLLYEDPCMKRGAKSLVTVKCMRDVKMDAIQSDLNNRRIEYDRLNNLHKIFYASVDPVELNWLCSRPWVQYVDCESEPGQPEDIDGRNLHRVNTIGSNYKENIFLKGNGVRVMVRDDGFVGPHIDFHGRIRQDVISDIGTHGDGVSGILTGAGNYDPLIEGMAPGAELYVINYQPDFLDKTLDFHQIDGVVITNSSYSNGCNAGYTIEAQVVDKQIFENPELIHVFSAGNSNNADCGYGAGNQWGNVTGGHKIGKNALTVANLRIDGSLETSSSRGPSRDGRLKPEIAARGTNQLSTAPGNGTLVFGGTSAASPGVAGVCALLYEAYKNSHNGQNPESALIKAAIMNTATDIGTPGPDYQFGFGVIDAYRAYQLIHQKRFQKEVIQHGETKEIQINVPAGSPLLKCMIYWAEPEASLMARKALINDLDLEVLDPSGNILKPWLLNPSPNPVTLAAGAGKGIDTLNNFEQVTVTKPVAGVYTIRVTGKFLPSNSVNFYVLYEIEDKILRLNFPIGAEKFSITENTQIHYTAYGNDSIKIQFSSDAGRNWQYLGAQPSGSRLHSIFIPNNTSSDSCLVEISQGNLVERSDYFTITNGVQGFKINKYCPNEIELAWKPNTKDSFLIYQLGDKYMEPLVITPDSVITLSNPDPRIKKWFSIAAYDKTILSRRELAIQTPDTLIGCGIVKDLGLALSSSNLNEYFSCGDLQVHLKLYVINRTNRVQSDFTIKALAGTKVVEQFFSDSVLPYDTLEISFTNDLQLKEFGKQTITAWLDYAFDENPYNDTLFVSLQIHELLDKTGTYPMLESISGADLPPFWFQKNSAVDSRWNVVSVKDKNGVTGSSLMFTNANSLYNSFPVNLYTRTVDLTNSNEPYLYLDFIHHHFTDNTFFDSVRIKVREICGNAHREKVLISGVSMELNTVEPTTNQNWLPHDTSWFYLAYDLSEFKGSKILIDFEIIRGRGNRTFLENIQVREKLPETKYADFTMNPDPGCFAKPVTFSDSSTINGALYLWDVGLFGSPRYYNEKGPFSSKYTSLGSKRVVYKIKSNVDNDAIVIKELKLANTPSVNYSFKIESGRTVKFTNTSVNADTYIWDFGDGTFSNEFHPTHTFDSAKVYRVKLTISNPCGNYSRSVLVDLLFTANEEILDEVDIAIFPNPADEYMTVKSKYRIKSFLLYNAEGKIVGRKESINAKEFTVSLRSLPSGMYKLKLLSTENTVIRNIQKQ